MDNSPFCFGIPVSTPFFTSRKKETGRLTSDFHSGVHSAIVAPRGTGKTSLMLHQIAQIGKNGVKTAYLDLTLVKTSSDFFKTYAEAIIRAFSPDIETAVKLSDKFLTRLRPKVMQMAKDAHPVSLDFEIEFDLNDKATILSLPEKLATEEGCKLFVGLDEFQQTLWYDDAELIYELMGNELKESRHSIHCFALNHEEAVSKLKLIEGKETAGTLDILELDNITEEEWRDYIQHRFSATGKTISMPLAEKISKAVECQSEYVQQLAWLVWAHSPSYAIEQSFRNAMHDLFEHNTPYYNTLLRNLTGYQLNFLKALLNGVEKGFTRRDNMKKYGLGTSANVKVIKEALLKKEIIEVKEHDCHITDKVFKEWLKKRLLINTVPSVAQ